jgi:flagellar basal-body rod protein FlgB
MFGDITFDALKAAMRGGMARQAAIAQNIANADTPGYRRLNVTFEDALAGAIDDARSRRGAAAFGDAGTGVTPVAFTSGEDVGDLQPVTAREADTRVRVDGSNVDPDREMSELAANQLAFNTASELMAARLNGYRTVLTGR